MTKRDIVLGAKFKNISKQSLIIEILEKNGTKFKVRYNNGGEKIWSQSHIVKYYMNYDN